ncbi:hypothetical protein TNCV_3761471 [Trichonephila clavipes]|nr:hypothetical protein TNCV_3761471 [Trichonephila clavipes]
MCFKVNSGAAVAQWSRYRIMTGCDEEDVEAWMACDSEDCGFQMLNDDEIVTSMQEKSDPIDNETDEDEDNNSHKSS